VTSETLDAVPGRSSGTERFEHWIGGRGVAPLGGAYRQTTSPIDRSVSFEIADGDGRDVDAAAAAASAARVRWATTSTTERSETLRAIGRAVRDNLDQLIEAEIAETGKLDAFARAEMLSCADYFEYYAAVVRTVHGETIDQGPGQHTYVRHEPFGVVAIIAPWNGPLNQASRGIAPALAAGNTVILKPSEFTSAATLRFARLASEAGLPDGVLNVVTGTGPAAGAALVRHPEVRRVTFTGSVPTGRTIAALAAERIIPVTLELGGKSPLLVFADADLDRAARAAVATALMNSGQVCSATTRLIVERSVQEDLLSRISAILVQKRPGVDFGPIITEPQFDKVLGFFASAAEQGATLVTGGTRYQEGAVAEGRYLPPTLYKDVTPDMRIACEEIFGPVLVALPFDTFGEAISLANGTDYGLASAVWTGDAARGLRAAHLIEAGQVSVNGGVMTQETPFGGYKNSGYGREKGASAIYEYTQVKTVGLDLASRA